MSGRPSSQVEPSFLATERLAKQYGGIHAVKDCSFGVEQGSITALIGPNGAGKTTVLNLINGLTTATAGRISFCGADITKTPAHRITRLGIGRTFQIGREFGSLSCVENVVLHARVSHLAQLLQPSVVDSQRRRALELLEFVGIAKFADAPAGELSFGQRKLLELAAVIMSEPTLIILDEPAGGINPALLDTVIDRIRELNRESGITFLIVEHNMDVVMELSDWVIVLDQGSVLSQGPPSIIQEDSRVLEAYLGG